MTLSRMGAAVVVLAIAAIALTPRVANAAAELSRSIPGPGTEVAESPADIELFFTQDLSEARLAVNGTDLAADVDEDHVTASLGSLEEGDYRVDWTVTSDVDDRETSGSFQFRVRAEPEPESPPEVDPEARAEQVEEVGDDNRTEVLFWTILGIAAAGVLALIFFYFRTSIPTFGSTGTQGGLPPPGESPPEHEDDHD
jgi:methionine-rich copper-binding protein CopC